MRGKKSGMHVMVKEEYGGNVEYVVKQPILIRTKT